MAFDGIVTKQIVTELQSCLLNGKINKIYEPNKNEILIGIYANGHNYALDIDISSNYYRLHITTYSKPNPTNAPNFCMVLRKHVIGYRITDIVMDGLERIVTISLEGFNELNDRTHKTLIIELMGKHSNILLLNENHRIIDSIRHLDQSTGSYRDILPARPYVEPNSDKQDFLTISYSDFETSFAPNISLSKQFCEHFTGISPTFIKVCLDTLQIQDSQYTNADLKKLYTYIKEILSKLGTSAVSCSLVQNGADYTIKLQPHTDTLLQTNFFLDDFYHLKQTDDLLKQYRNDLLRFVLAALKKVNKKIYHIHQKLQECYNMDTYRIYGELLTSNLYQIDNHARLESITLEDYYHNNQPITIPLDASISPSYNAKKYFKKYNKLKNTLAIVSTQKEEAQKELDYLESVVYELESVTQISEIDDIYQEISENILLKPNKKTVSVKKNKVDKRKTQDTYEPLVYQVNGFDLYVGKNNKQNDYLTTKLGKNEDLWFHTKDIRGSHALLKCNGMATSIDQDTICTCAQITAFHSKAKLSSQVPVDYCFVKHVKKPSGSKPGMVIYTNYKTVYVDPQEH
ncbi:MAG: NFACT family protein [Clostridia bacterium]